MLNFTTLAGKIFGTSNERKLKVYKSKVGAINALEREVEKLTDAALRERTAEFRRQLAQGASLDDILAPAFATVREAAKRTLGQRHFDVQLIGGMVLHDGKIAEMKTGEGKTLVATLPVYLNALAGKGVHVVTVNDYLAKRDAEWMGAIYKFLGLTVGCIVHDLTPQQRRAAYACDVTYGTNNEFGFDYLRDNMEHSLASMVQFGFRLFPQVIRQAVKEARAGSEPNLERAVHCANQTFELAAEVLGAPKLRAGEGGQPDLASGERDSRLAKLVESLAQLQPEIAKAGGAGSKSPAAHQVATKLIETCEAIGALIGEGNIAHLGNGRAAKRGNGTAEDDDAPSHVNEVRDSGHFFAIVDEVDSILIDEARTPLIISGPVEDKSNLYNAVNELVKDLSPEHFELDLKQKQAALTEIGNEVMEQRLRDAGLLTVGSLYDVENVRLVHHVNQALRAHQLFQRDRDYIVKDGQVIIIDEFTGRMMHGRRYSDGFHQALEAKEHVAIQPENRTLASITFQNYFRLYKKLAGMTGTALTEAAEFMDIYGLDVVEIPTNMPVARVDEDDEVYRTQTEKYRAIIKLIKDCRERGQPVLVGTTSIEKSERLSGFLKDRKLLKELGIDEPIPHQVLNARYHEQEAMIIAQAGVPGAVTIATNMAGRGTDIQLGGNVDYRLREWIEEQKRKTGKEPDAAATAAERAKIQADVAEKKQKALAAGGLYVVGTERHESRRIDNQLRGRSGRQGDPGRSKFYLALDDDLMKIFGSDRMDSVLQRLGLEENEAIMHPWINKALEKAQQKVEMRNFDARKYILKYDDVMNDQRKVIFEQRIGLMGDEDVHQTVVDMRQQVIDDLIARHIPEKAYAEQWDVEGLKQAAKGIFGLDLPVEKWAAEEGIADVEIRERLQAAVDEAAQKQWEKMGEVAPQVEKMFLLQTLDHLWREHIVNIEYMREVIGLRGYGQRDPLNEYKTEAFSLFEGMLANLRLAVTGNLMNVEIRRNGPPPIEPEPVPPLTATHINPLTGENEFETPEEAEAAAVVRSARQGGGVAVAEKPKAQPVRRRAPSGAPAATAQDGEHEGWGKVARNAPCPCGSGKKYKHCHGKA